MSPLRHFIPTSPFLSCQKPSTLDFFGWITLTSSVRSSGFLRVVPTPCLFRHIDVEGLCSFYATLWTKNKVRDYFWKMMTIRIKEVNNYKYNKSQNFQLYSLRWKGPRFKIFFKNLLYIFWIIDVYLSTNLGPYFSYNIRWLQFSTGINCVRHLSHKLYNFYNNLLHLISD